MQSDWLHAHTEWNVLHGDSLTVGILYTCVRRRQSRLAVQHLKGSSKTFIVDIYIQQGDLYTRRFWWRIIRFDGFIYKQPEGCRNVIEAITIHDDDHHFPSRHCRRIWEAGRSLPCINKSTMSCPSSCVRRRQKEKPERIKKKKI